MFRSSAAVLFGSFLLLTACGNGIRTKEKVQEAIVNRLQTRSGLDLNSLDVTTTNVAFDKNKATATVSFHPKGDSRVDSGMEMRYTLEDRGGKWVVVNVADSQGHGLMGGHAGSMGQLPPGHPSVNSPPELPPGVTNSPHNAQSDQQGAHK